jgi:hypothetical protein
MSEDQECNGVANFKTAVIIFQNAILGISCGTTSG